MLAAVASSCSSIPAGHQHVSCMQCHHDTQGKARSSDKRKGARSNLGKLAPDLSQFKRRTEEPHDGSKTKECDLPDKFEEPIQSVRLSRPSVQSGWNCREQRGVDRSKQCSTAKRTAAERHLVPAARTRSSTSSSTILRFWKSRSR